MRRVQIAWNKFTATPVTTGLAGVVPEADLAGFIQKAQTARHPAYQLSGDLFVEIPPPGWGHGDLLIYLPRRGWLVRRNYVDHWYIDIGIFRRATGTAFGWTDLWLDVIAPRQADRYHLLDADEFAAALAGHQVSTDLAAYALNSLHQLTETLHSGAFPIPEVLQAEAFAQELARSQTAE